MILLNEHIASPKGQLPRSDALALSPLPTDPSQSEVLFSSFVLEMGENSTDEVEEAEIVQTSQILIEDEERQVKDLQVSPTVTNDVADKEGAEKALGFALPQPQQDALIVDSETQAVETLPKRIREDHAVRPRIQQSQVTSVSTFVFESDGEIDRSRVLTIPTIAPKEPHLVVNSHQTELDQRRVASEAVEPIVKDEPTAQLGLKEKEPSESIQQVSASKAVEKSLTVDRTKQEISLEGPLRPATEAMAAHQPLRRRWNAADISQPRNSEDAPIPPQSSSFSALQQRTAPILLGGSKSTMIAPSEELKTSVTQLTTQEFMPFSERQMPSRPHIAEPALQNSIAPNTHKFLPANNIQSISEAALVLRESSGRIDVTLAPEELGRLSIKLDQTPQGPLFTLSAERGETQEMIRRHLDQLHEQFRELGFENASFAFRDQHQAPMSESDADPDEPTFVMTSNETLEKTELTGLAPISGLDIRI